MSEITTNNERFGYCKNCNSKTIGNFCSECGQSTRVSRFTLKHLTHEFVHGFFHIDSGILFTLNSFLKNPGRSLREYLQGKRIYHVNPFTLILILGTLSTFILAKVGVESLLIDLKIIDKTYLKTESWQYSIEHFTYRILLGVPLYALITSTFFYSKDNNFVEHIIINSFLRGIADIFLLITALILYQIQSNKINLTVKLFSLIVVLFYYAWAYSGVFYPKHKVSSFAKCLLCSMLCYISELIILNKLIT